MGEIFDVVGIPLLVFAVCIYYGVRLLVTKNSSFLRGPQSKGPKDELGYSKSAAIMIFCFGIVTLGMGALMFLNAKLGIAGIVIATIIFGACWKRLNDKHGI